MNYEHFRILRDKLQSIEEKKFIMLDFFQHSGRTRVPGMNRCGTAACIGGWATWFAVGERATNRDDCFEVARAWLGLEEYEFDRLAYGHWSSKDLEQITLADAIEYLSFIVDHQPTTLAPEADDEL
jgi:hypothetical protein